MSFSINFFEMQPWQYLFISGTILIIFELVISEFFLLWIGISFLFTGLTAYLFPINIKHIIIIFSLFSIIFLYTGYGIYKKRSSKRMANHLNTGKEKLIGREIILTTNVFAKDNQFHATVDGTLWPISCFQTLSPGDKVKIVEVVGNILIVEKIIPINS